LYFINRRKVEMTEQVTPPTEMVAAIPMPEPTPAAVTTAKTLTPDQARIEELERHAKNKEEEAARVQKKLAAFEKAEADRKQAEMTDAEKLTARLKELENESRTYKRIELQRRVAEKVGLPSNLASRLIGETEEEIETDAKALLETLPKAAPKTPGINTTNPGETEPIQETYEQVKARVRPEPVSIFTGGKVVWDNVKKE
jgi:hypothetical protein